MRSKHKIVHVTISPHVRHARIFEKECRSLTTDGHEVVLVAPYHQDDVIAGVQVRAIPQTSNRAARMMVNSWRALSIALREKGDIYHLHDPELLLPFQFARLANGAIVFDMHENLPKAIVAKDWISPLLRPFVAELSKILLRVLLWRIPVIFAEHSYRGDFHWVQQSTIVLNYPRLDFLTPAANRPRDFRMVYFGLVNRQRGLLVMLEALVWLRQRGRRFPLELIGRISTEDRALVENFARSNDLQITMRGFLPLEIACPIVNTCSLGLALLQPLPNYVDSYPGKIFDYMAMGLPVLSSDFPLYRSVVEDAGCGRCVDSTRPELVAQAILEVAENWDSASLMGSNGLKVVRSKHDWMHQYRNLIHFYEMILGKQKLRPEVQVRRAQ